MSKTAPTLSLSNKKYKNSLSSSFFTLLHRGQALAVGPEPGLLRVELEDLGRGVGLVGWGWFVFFEEEGDWEKEGVRVFSSVARYENGGDFSEVPACFESLVARVPGS